MSQKKIKFEYFWFKYTWLNLSQNQKLEFVECVNVQKYRGTCDMSSGCAMKGTSYFIYYVLGIAFECKFVNNFFCWTIHNFFMHNNA